MKGYPIGELDPLSKKVLVDLYDELMDDVQSETGKQDLERMNSVFMAEINGRPAESKSDQGLEYTLLDPELNPLQIPLELLERREDLLKASNHWELVPALEND
jgi:hypothetical protein